jgi:putative DNA methylase
MKTPRKLIEVALPLDKINAAAARAVIFAQMVNDPGYERHLRRGVNKEKAAIERERLFKIIEDLVLWENTNNEAVLNEVREEIRKSWRETCELNRLPSASHRIVQSREAAGFS